MTFFVGQRVVCVDGSRFGEAKTFPIEGSIYTVRELHDTGFGVGVYLHEVVNKPYHYKQGWFEPCFRTSRFRPLVENKDQSFFTQGAPKDSEKFDNRLPQKVREKVQ